MRQAEPDPRWLRLWAQFRATDAQAHAAWSDLVARYSAPGRAYHTLEHVLQCQDEFDCCRPLTCDPEVLEAALWFHDAVYDPRSSDNEEASALCARQQLEVTALSPERLARVERLILVTRHTSVAAEGDSALITDIDLAILGAPPEQYERYEEAIAREYAWVPEAVFRTRRAELLAGFLARPALFATQMFRDRLETQARANLARSIARLRRGP